MKKITKRLAGLLAIVMLLTVIMTSFVGCTINPKYEGTWEYITREYVYTVRLGEDACKDYFENVNFYFSYGRPDPDDGFCRYYYGNCFTIGNLLFVKAYSAWTDEVSGVYLLTKLNDNTLTIKKISFSNDNAIFIESGTYTYDNSVG